MPGHPLKQEIRFLKGVGEKRAQCYARLGVSTVYDLLRFYPRDYIDYSRPCTIADASLEQPSVVRATVYKKGKEQRIRKGLSIFKIFVTDEISDMTVTIFNSRFAAEALKVGESYLFYGRVTGNLLRREMSSPQILREAKNAVMQPVYPLTEGLTNKMVSANMEQAVAFLAEEQGDYLPAEMRETYRLCSVQQALKNIHFPESEEGLAAAKRRLVFEELLTLELGLSRMRAQNRAGTAVRIPEADLTPFIRSLPFQMTGAQLRCIEEAMGDMSREVPMNRLLQGDVGSGKTMVAAALIYAAAQAGYQSALMAPTEILAKQHYSTLSKLLEPLGLQVGLLVGSMTAKQKAEMRQALADGVYTLAVGTHALVQEDTAFRKLGLVVTDEQHRFGVAQRGSLAAKGEQPHVLVMSATPIPRTLALLIYGDLDISVLDELPGGRRPIETYRISGAKRERAYRFVAKHLDAGRQAYLVCPLIEENETLELASVEKYARLVRQNYLPDYRLGVLHGRLKAAEKQQIMEEFVSGKLQVLVATTVIEVGIDVPNANVMLIENAERFGLSQLHQLRGRVGRGAEQSYCILVSNHRGEETRRRLSVMCETADGFRIAEEDLKLRGPGDFFGARQHGLPQLRIADMMGDMETLSEVKELAAKILAEDPELARPEHRGLAVLVKELFRRTPEHGNN
ncbi:MAG: ATP-dependent DNA helicase RecG [Oscillospiraceae bacterium]